MRTLIFRSVPALLGLALGSLTAHAASITGTLTYLGRQTGEVWVAASLNTNALFAHTRLDVPASVPFTNAPFTLSNLFAGGSYQVFAWRDSVSNNASDLTEAQAWHPGGTFLVLETLAITNFDITDPDLDADKLPDWWEVRYGLDQRMGSGRSGALRLHPGQTNYTDAVWARVLGANPAGGTALNVSTTNGFATNDLVLILSMQDTNLNLGLNQAGTCEFGRIAALTQGGGATNLVLTAPHTNSFTPGTAQKIQVVKVPEYTALTLDGSALSFYGTNTVRVPNFGWSMPTNEITVEAWLRVVTNKYQWPVVFYLDPDDTANRFLAHVGSRYPYNYWSYWHFGNLNSGGRCDYVRTPAAGAWEHHAWVASQSGNFMKVFLNGIEDHSVSNFSASGFTRGQYDLVLGFNFFGDMHDFRVWNKARTQAEIQNDMHHVLSGQEPGLVAYYRLDEGGGTNVLDATGHGHHGAWANAPAWVSASTLTCQSWNGTNGGVLAFLTHELMLASNSVINADGKGYRGGPNYAQADVDGYQGESLGGTWPVHSITNNLGGGGGGGRSYYASGNSGGGGGYGLPGAIGLVTPVNYSNNDRPTATNSAFGGSSYGTSNLARLLMGSGGGSGGQDGNDTGDANANGGVGGAGGGIFYCSAGFLANSGRISSSGQDGSSQVAGERGVGGAGAGGTVWITANWLPADGVVLARGGVEGRSGSYVGGAGGAGRIRLDLPPGAVAPVLDPAAGCVEHLDAEPAALWSPYHDTDQDGVSDLSEYLLDLNPIESDSDGDTLPDGWEVANGLNPADPADAASDADADGLASAVEFHWRTDPRDDDSDGDGLNDSDELFLHRTDPLVADTDGDGMSDQAEVAAGSDPLFAGTRYFYDALDRLVGVQHENGLALGYEYDPNNNLVRQFYAERDSNTNALPDLWESLTGLTNNPSAFADTDHDGWSDHQEWQTGTNPLDPNSHPDLVGSAGTQVASISWPFAPSNFVVGVGQLDGLGAEEIVISADGDPGGATNFLLVLSQAHSTWSTQKVEVGSVGVTSIAVGQPTNCPSPAIYIGLRRAGGLGGVMEFKQAGNLWSSNTIATSTNDRAFVLGVRAGQDVVASLATSNAPPGGAWYFWFASAWTNLIADTNTSQRGLAALTQPGLHGIASSGMRLLDVGGVQMGFGSSSVRAGESSASARLLWRGHSLTAGDLRLTNAVSVLYAFVDDKNLNGAMDAGDDFVVTEYSYSGTTVATNTPQRASLSGPTLAPSYGLASVDVLYGNQQVFFTAEPDGQVFSWTAPDVTAPLQRQLFSAQYAGMGWHALAGARTLEPAQSLVGLCVDPAAPNRCDVIVWPPLQQLWTPAAVPQTAPITSILPDPHQGRDLALVDLRLWDAEGNLATPALQYRLTNSLSWSNATLAAINGAAYGPVTTSPTGHIHRASWAAGLDLGAGFTNSVWLRARAHDVSLTGDWSSEVLYSVQNSAALPVASNDVATTYENTAVNIDVLANDTVTVPPKRVTSVGLPAHGTAATNLNGTVRYTPATGFTGIDQFTYTLADGAGGSSIGLVTVTVIPGAPVVIVLSSPLLQGGTQFSMIVSGWPGQVYQVQASTNLSTWTDIGLLTNVSGTVLFNEQVPTNARVRFYRTLLP